MAVGISSTLARDSQSLENVTHISLSQLVRDDSIGTFMVHEAHLMVMAVLQMQAERLQEGIQYQSERCASTICYKARLYHISCVGQEFI
jgi:DNA repair protein RadC